MKYMDDLEGYKFECWRLIDPILFSTGQESIAKHFQAFCEDLGHEGHVTCNYWVLTGTKRWCVFSAEMSNIVNGESQIYLKSLCSNCACMLLPKSSIQPWSAITYPRIRENTSPFHFTCHSTNLIMLPGLLQEVNIHSFCAKEIGFIPILNSLYPHY